MTTLRTFCRLLAVIPFAALAACAAGPDDAQSTESVGVDDAELNLVAVAERANGNTLRFYEPEPGRVLTVEVGAAASMPALDDALALFRAAAPAAPVPAALVEAQARADALQLLDNPADFEARVGMSLPAALAVDEAPAGGARDGSACAINTFIGSECTSGDQMWCKISWANGFYAYNSSVNWMHNAVCSLTGTVTLKLIVDSDLKGSWAIGPGQKGKVAWIQHPIYLPLPPFYLSNRFGFYTEITNASGDVFHVGGAAGDE
jgi:hypothetical protein